MIFTDDGDDGFGVILLMKFESESDRDGVEVAIEQEFVTTLENVAIESSKGNEDVQESVSDREPCMILSIASIAKKTRKARRKQDW